MKKIAQITAAVILVSACAMAQQREPVPAFEGQTDASATSPSRYRIETITEALTDPGKANVNRTTLISIHR